MKFTSLMTLLGFLLFTNVLFAQNNQPANTQKPAMTPYWEGCQFPQDLDGQENCTVQKIRQHVYKNLGKPFTIKEFGKERKSVKYSFVIGSDGQLKDVTIDSDPGYGYGAAVLQSLNSLPTFSFPDLAKNRVIKSRRIKAEISRNRDQVFYKRYIDREIKPGSEIFQVVEVMPMFPGCEKVKDKKEKQVCSRQKLTDFVNRNLQFPSSALESKTEGKVILRFVVDKDGSLINPKIVRSLTPDCDTEALRIVELMPKFNIGTQRNKPVKVYYNLVVNFNIEK